MAEGPQVLRRTEWLNRYLSGRKILRCVSQREDISADIAHVFSTIIAVDWLWWIRQAGGVVVA